MYCIKFQSFTHFFKGIILAFFKTYFQQKMEQYMEILEMHCRVCGERLGKAKKKTFSYACSEHKKALQTHLGLMCPVT